VDVASFSRGPGAAESLAPEALEVRRGEQCGIVKPAVGIQRIPKTRGGGLETACDVILKHLRRKNHDLKPSRAVALGILGRGGLEGRDGKSQERCRHQPRDVVVPRESKERVEPALFEVSSTGLVFTALTN